MKKKDGAKQAKDESEDPIRLMSCIWGHRKVTRLNKVIAANYCGRMTVREFVALVLVDNVNFPNGIDTPMCIGDFEGNFCTNVLHISMGGDNDDHVCVRGDPHGCME